MTCRRLEQRIGEHSTSVSTAVLQHMTSLGHDVAFNEPQILAHEIIGFDWVSAVLQHMTSLGHDVAFNDPHILAHEIIGFDWVSKKHLISTATKPISLLTRTQALMVIW